MTYILLRDINWTTFGYVMLIVAALSVIFAVLIVLVSKLCYVKEDEKTKAVSEKLAGANCGGCGFAGCADFAKALSEGKADLSMCGPTPSRNKAEIAKILGVPFTAEEQACAVVKCAGGTQSKNKYVFVGNEGCVMQSSYLGGKKECPSGCMGEGTCAKVCPYHAITVINGVSYADKALCEACGLCVKNCPKHIIELIPKSSKVYVACSSHCKGKEVMSVCKVGCIGCGLCARNCPEHAITMVDNLPVIDYAKCSGCKTCVAKCPRKIIKEI